MEENELRIGNWFHPVEFGSSNMIYTLKDKYRKIDFATFKSVKEWGGDLLQPVLLTEDLLIKCGFHYYEEDDCWKICGLSIKKEDCGFRIYIECEDAWYSYCYFKTFKYLHQLQNIYFDLTGKELKVDL